MGISLNCSLVFQVGGLHNAGRSDRSMESQVGLTRKTETCSHKVLETDDKRDERGGVLSGELQRLQRHPGGGLLGDFF